MWEGGLSPPRAVLSAQPAVPAGAHALRWVTVDRSQRWFLFARSMGLGVGASETCALSRRAHAGVR